MVNVESVTALDPNRFAACVEKLCPFCDVVRGAAIVDFNTIKAGVDDEEYVLFVMRLPNAVLAHWRVAP